MVRGRLILLAACVVAAPAFAGALDLEIGKALFERSWVSAPASTKADDGLGPLFEARSCAACHDARDTRVDYAGRVIRLGSRDGGGDPVYGLQLQQSAVPGVKPEGHANFGWGAENGLRTRTLRLNDLGYGALADTTNTSVRRPLDLNGLGVLARIPEGEILKRTSLRSDGISGRAAWLVQPDGTRRLGRFGWKASAADLGAQVDAAFSRDLGMSTASQPAAFGDCTPAQRLCRDAPHGAPADEAEISATLRNMLVNYVASRRAPAVAPSDAKGAALFASTGCALCHATLTGADGKPVAAFTDLLLHDMGSGLDDGVAEGAAASSEWRTAPLWGLRTRLGEGLLHDGRARSVVEAVAWHGGEAAAARARFRALGEADKKALLAYVEGL